MSHHEQLSALEIIKSGLNLVEYSVLEVGSYDVNGTVRNVFVTDDYIGIDLVAGPGVDIVVCPESFEFDRKFDVVVSSECFEHNPFWRDTLANMILCCKQNGYIIVTCATTGRFEHGTHRTDPSISPGTSAVGLHYYKNISAEDVVLELNKLQISNYVLVKQSRTFDLYVLISLDGIIPPDIKRRLALISRPTFTISNLIRMVYMLPPRIILFLRLPEDFYMNFCVTYERLVKIQILKLISYVNKVYGRYRR